MTPTSRSHESLSHPNTSFLSISSQSHSNQDSVNLTSTPNQTTSNSSFKSPLSSNVSNSKNTKTPTSATEYPDEISFLLQRPGNLTITIQNFHLKYE